MTSIENQISTILFTAIETAIGGNQTPTKWPLRTFNIPNDGKWIEVIQIRNNPSDEYWNEEKIYQGLVRVLLHWPASDEGAIEPTGIIDNAAEALPKGNVSLPPVRVVFYDNPDVGTPVEDGADNIFPLTLRYRCFYTG